MNIIHIIKKHGGARKGAGRKPGGGKRNRITRSVSLPVETWRMIDSQRGEVNRSRWIERVVNAE